MPHYENEITIFVFDIKGNSRPTRSVTDITLNWKIEIEWSAVFSLANNKVPTYTYQVGYMHSWVGREIFYVYILHMDMDWIPI